jgi:hypothetical protein
VQRGVFLGYLQRRFHPNEPPEVVSLEQYFQEVEAECAAEGMSGFSSKLHKITLSVRHARELRRLLRKEGYDASTLMLGAEGCVEALLESCHEED